MSDCMRTNSATYYFTSKSVGKESVASIVVVK